MRNLVTGIVAGVIVFIWVMISWMVLPFHNNSINTFQNPEAVLTAVTTNTSGAGIYVYPGMDSTPEEMAKEPHIVTTISLAGKNMMVCMAIGLLIQCLAGLFITSLLAKANVSNFSSKIGTVLRAVLFAGVVGLLPSWLWWGFTPSFVFLGFIDLLIGWSLAGIWIAKRV